MLGKLLPRENAFLSLFDKAADLIVDGCTILKEMVVDLPSAEEYARRIKDVERDCDDVTHDTYRLLHKTFITPLERGDIHSLISSLDDILDLINAFAQRLAFYEVKKVPQEAVDLVDVLDRTVAEVRQAVHGLNNLKRANEILEHCININSLENEGDTIHRAGLAKLFKEEKDPIRILKWRELLGELENAIDRCELVAHLVQGIILENT
ncbi:MAG: DUF47 domain-containing protein [Bradymonadales bacterium]|nr:DUF47 domain-containing protein [Bradymonadales bacterium]